MKNTLYTSAVAEPYSRLLRAIRLHSRLSLLALAVSIGCLAAAFAGAGCLWLVSAALASGIDLWAQMEGHVLEVERALNGVEVTRTKHF